MVLFCLLCCLKQCAARWGQRKSNAKEDFRVVLLGGSSSTSRIKQLLMIDPPTPAPSPTLYSITNTSILEFNLKTSTFLLPQLLKTQSQILHKVAICGSMLAYLTAEGELYLQVLPQKLREVRERDEKRGFVRRGKDREEVNRILVHRFGDEEIIYLGGLCEEQWIVCTPNKLTIINTTLTSSQTFTPKFRTLPLSNPPSSTQKITQACPLSYPYLALLTTQKSLLIVDALDLKVTNTMCNDANFTTLCYNGGLRVLVVGDFGGFLMALSFNREFGDIQEQGIGVKKGVVDDPLPAENEMFSTRYLPQKHAKSPSKKPTTSPQLFNKEVKTAFTTIVQNPFRNPIELLSTKQSTVFSYESKYHKCIKLWNIASLQVYQKLELNLEIYEMKVCGYGLYLVSREKGYLCCYPFQQIEIGGSKRIGMQVLELAINSNIMFVSATNMSQNVVFKLRLSNKPSLSEYARKATKNAEKLLKYAFYKNEVILFNLTKSQMPVLESYGIFGESKETIKDLNSYHSMVKYPHKEGIILWSDRKVYIRCKVGHRPVIRKRFTKGQHIFENEPQSKKKEEIYTQIITMSEQISKIKCFQNYITIICKANADPNAQPNEKENPVEQFTQKSNSYLIDENTMCLSLIFNELNQNYRIIESHKYYSLLIKNHKKQKVKSYYLYAHKDQKMIWKADTIQGWALETVNMINVDAKAVEIICIYKSTTISSDSTKNDAKPIFYIIKSKISVSAEEKSFVSISDASTHAHSESQTIQEIKCRSIFHKIKNEQISNAQSQKMIDVSCVKSSFKVFMPSVQIANIKWSDFDGKIIQGKLLHYQKDQGVLMFGVSFGSFAILYQIESQPVAEVIGILNFDKIGQNSQQEEIDIQDCIVYWNKNYKKDDQQLWQQAKNSAINRIKDRNSPFLYRSDSLRSTNKKWNPENLEEKIILPSLQKRSRSYNKIPPSIANPQRVNQLIHKHNIYESLMKEKMGNQEKKPIKSSTVPMRTITQPSQSLLKLYETPMKVKNSQAKTKEETFTHKKNTQSTINKEMGQSSSKRRYKTESYEVLPKFRLTQEEPIERKSSKTRQSNFKSSEHSNKKGESEANLALPMEIKKELTFEDLIRETKTTFEKKSIERIIKKASKPLLSPQKRYQTQPEQQLQKSKIIQKAILPHLPAAQKQAARKQIYEKSLVFNMLSKQKHKMKTTLLNHNLDISEQVETEIMQEVKIAMAKMRKK